MSKFATTPLKLFQQLLINPTVTTTELRLLPFHQMPTHCSLCSTNNCKGTFCLVGDAYAHPRNVPPPHCATGIGPAWHAAPQKCLRCLATTELGRQTQGSSRTGLAPARSVVCACSDVHSSLSPFLWIFVGMEEQPLLLGIDYFSLSSHIH